MDVRRRRQGHCEDLCAEGHRGERGEVPAARPGPKPVGPKPPVPAEP